MGEETRLWKWGVIVALTALAILVLWPPSDTLKPGIDLAGGTSLIYEIDTAGMSESAKSGLAERVINILRARVDPNAQFNLVWRPIGSNRIEIQMPRPPKEAKQRRDQYEAARSKISALNVPRTELEQVLTLSGDARQAGLDRLAHDVEGRRALLDAVAEAWDAYSAVRNTGDIGAEVRAQAAYEAALEAVLATNLSLGRVTDILALRGDERKTELDALMAEYPAYTSAIEETVAAYDAWEDKRGSLEDPADLKRLLRGAGVLEFRILASRSETDRSMLKAPDDPSLNEPVDEYVEQLKRRGPRARAEDNYAWFPIDDVVKFMQSETMEQAQQRIESGSLVVEKYAGKYYVLAHTASKLDTDYGLTQDSEWELKRAYPAQDYQTGRPSVQFMLDPRGGAIFADLTRKNKGRELTIFLDGIATSHATIQSQIGQRGQITGDFTQERVMEIVRKLEAGSLPARLKETPLSEKNTGPQLGRANRERGMRAAIYGFVAVGIFMLVYYLFAGILANIALVLNLLFVLAIMAGLEATFTLPGIAGLLLTVGMAVDANVLIYERIREERDRGVALKKAVKTGYERALSTIVDANLTTLITCIILGYVGSEEVKGFAMTLGFGIVTSMFTALFVTRVIIMTLIEKRLLSNLVMFQLIQRPNINWLGLRRAFWPISMTLVVLGFGYFVYIANTNKEAIYDIEFLGGTSVDIVLTEDADLSAEQVRAAVTGKGDYEGTTAVEWLRNAAEALRNADLAAVEGSMGEYTVTSDELAPGDINALLRAAFEESLALGGFSGSGSTARFVTKARTIPAPTEEDPDAVREEMVSLADFEAGVAAAADYAEQAAERLSGARVTTAWDVTEENPAAATTEVARGTAADATVEPPSANAGEAFEIATVESNKEVVRAALVGTFGQKLKVQQRIEHELVTDPERAPTGMFPVTEDANFLGEVIGGDSPAAVHEHKGGVALVFDNLDPPQTIDALEKRFKQMRLQPQFQQYEARGYDIFGLEEAGDAEEGEHRYTKVALVVSDENLIFSEGREQWLEQLAKPELQQAQEALNAEESLRKVVQFAPQIASQTQQRALIAMVLALGAIVAYIWLRFGTMQYGLAAIVALVHDVSITLGVITLADVAGIGEFRIDLAMIAALLTVVGYSLNDTIVVFDRIRENRGKLSKLSPNIINNSINMTLSRTLLTSSTTLLAVVFLFFMGGPGVRGFSFALLCGVIVGTYSSIAIAAPLLQNRKLLHIIIYLLIAIGVVSLTAALTDSRVALLIVAGLMLVFLGFAINVERRMDLPSGAAATA